MSAQFMSAYTMSPLADCTNAVDNAENIFGNRTKAIKANKPYASPAFTVSACQYDATQQNRHNTRSVVMSATTTKSQTPRLPSARPTPLQLPKSTTAPATTTTTPSNTPSPMRHDPYSPCILGTHMSPEDSFVAAYVDAPITAEGATTPNQPSITPAKTCAVPAPRSVLALAQATQQSHRHSSAAVSAAAAAAVIQCTPEKARRAPSDSPLRGHTDSVNTSLNTSIGSPSMGNSPSVNRTVVKTVVRCNVDRTSGRPIPVKKQVA